MRTSPNVIITGTPGVGKTVHCEQLAQDTGLKHLSVNQIAKERDCFEEYDEERKSWVVDEDKVCRLFCFLWRRAMCILLRCAGLVFSPHLFFSLFLVGLRGVVLVAVALSRRVLIGFSRLVARCY